MTDYAMKELVHMLRGKGVWDRADMYLWNMLAEFVEHVRSEEGE